MHKSCSYEKMDGPYCNPSAMDVLKKLEPEEMKELLNSLFLCKTPNYSPEGKPTFYIFELGKLESYFNRL